MRKDDIRKLTSLAMFISAALILHVVEAMIPLPFPVPGIKLGLANIVTLLAIIFFDFKDVLVIVLLRCFMGSVFGGSISGFLFSISGGILSAFVMWFFYRKLSKYFSLVGISTAGAVVHNIGQLFMAGIIISDFRIYLYLPVLMTASVCTGIFIGIVCNYTKRLIISNVNKLGFSLSGNDLRC